VITGFEPLDILLGISEALDMLQSNTPEVRNTYSRVVKEEGNPAARAMIDQVFRVDDIEWRGIGVLPATGLAIRDEYAGFDAAAKFGLTLGESVMPQGCSCGEVLKGKIGPKDCPLFAKTCTPENPVGPCMVSSEGSCAAYYKYERN
jgi:hydrogenase expression/formation protein HypD